MIALKNTVTEREMMAQTIAYIGSGIQNALPIRKDFDLAEKMIRLVKEELGMNKVNL